MPCASEIAQVDDRLELVGSILSIDSKPWSLWRKIVPSPNTAKVCEVIVFGGDRVNPALSKAKHILMEPGSIAKFCQNGMTGTFDAIIVDHAAHSIITTWAGRDSMPWLQRLLKSADGLLWVTESNENSPSINVAGSLLRTLQAEKPSLKVQWLALKDQQEYLDEGYWQIIERVYTEMINGANELLVQSDNDAMKVVRHYPDDLLSTEVGLEPPRKSNVPLGSRNHSVELMCHESQSSCPQIRRLIM